MVLKEESARLASLEKKIDEINAKLGHVEKLLKKTLREEEQELKEEKTLEKEEDVEIKRLEELERVEQQLQREVNPEPLTKITKHDIAKAFVGALMGVIGHFAFFYGVEISKELTMTRASLLLITSFIVCVVFLYFTGFRKISDKVLIKFLPLRAIVLYATSLFVVVIVLTLFGFVSQDVASFYKEIASISLLAVLGASTADLIGRD
ncbi:hypothetical protein J7L02_02225 [Candidatus Woesearchaeota archaeon]|nr:hypothetical protein [Candidatus Woesearchaeota archaeon]